MTDVTEARRVGRSAGGLLCCEPMTRSRLGCVFVLASALAPLTIPAAGSLQAKANGVRITFPSATTEIDTWMDRNGWTSFRGDHRHFAVGQGRLRMVSADDSVSIQTERGFPIDPRQHPTLRLRVRVTAIPRGTDLTKKTGDDAAFRLYVAFDRGGFVGLMPPNTIAYTWTESVPAGKILQSEHFERLRYMSIGHGVPAPDPSSTGWVTITRDLVADYQRVFPEDTDGIPPVLGLVLKCDSNNTHTSAEAWVSRISLD